MGLPGDPAADLQRDMRAFSEGDLRTDSCGDCRSDLRTDSYRDSDADLRRDSQRDLQGDFRCGFDRDLRAEKQQRKRIGHERKHEANTATQRIMENYGDTTDDS